MHVAHYRWFLLKQKRVLQRKMMQIRQSPVESEADARGKRRKSTNHVNKG